MIPLGAEQRARLVEREAQVGPAQLGQLAREPQAVQAERRLLARREHDPQLCRQPREQHLQPGERVVASRARAGRRSPAATGSSSCSSWASSRSTTTAPAKLGAGLTRSIDLVAGGVGERVDHVKPEPLRVTLAALDRDPRDGLVRLARPTSAAERSSRFPQVRRRA